MQNIYTDRRLSIGENFHFYGNPYNPLIIGDTISVWHDKERVGLGDEIVYGAATVLETPNHPYGTYKALVTQRKA